MKKITLQIHVPPYSGAQVVEALDAAMVGAVFDFEVSLLFRGAGVYCLIPDQAGDSIKSKTISKILSALPAYDVEHIYACARALEKSGLSVNDLVSGVQVLQPEDAGQLLAAQDAVIGL